MKAWSVAIGLALAGALPAAAADPPLMCFGNEPSWGLALENPDTARLMIPDEPPAAYRGTTARLESLRERAWRGTREGHGSADLVAFLRETECSDGMSDRKHPVVARVSLPDGRFLAGCCRVIAAQAPAPPASGAAPSTHTPTAAIEGPVWRLTRLVGQDDQALAALSQGITLRFEAGQIHGFGGCNQIVGAYTVDRDRLTLGPLAGTMMACAPPVLAVETAFKNALSSTLRFAVAEDRLTLGAESGTDPTLVFAPAPVPRLDGVVWEVNGFNNGRHAVVSPVAGTTLTVEFREGTVVGHAGCNRFQAPYTRDGSRLAVGRAATTRMHCSGAGVMEQEREFLATLESATTWAIDREMLDLRRADGERVLLARKSVK